MSYIDQFREWRKQLWENGAEVQRFPPLDCFMNFEDKNGDFAKEFKSKMSGIIVFVVFLTCF